MKSDYAASVALDRLEQILRDRGMNIFARVRHSDAATGVGLTMRDTELLLFGNPKLGSKLMICAQTAAIDLPLKALAYQDEAGQVWLAYNDPDYLAKRHRIAGCDAVLQKMGKALQQFLTQAAG